MKTTLIRRSSVSLFAMMVMAFCFVASSASASWVVDADRTSFYGAGTTFTMEGNLASFAGNYTEAGGTVTNGTDKTVTTSTDSGDWYFSLNPGVAVSTYRYAEVFYSLGDDWSGSTHQLRLDTSVEGADWDDPGNESDFPAGTGDHSIVIDLLSDDGITPTAPARWSGNWTYFRWDFFNNVGNSNKTFTLDKVVFASEALAVSLGPVASLGGADAYSGGATLRGELLDDEPANAYICWGESDGGTVSTGHWDHVVSFVSVSTGVVFSAEVSNLYYGIEYDYRVYVTNATDSHWSALGTPFATPHVQRGFLFGDDSDDGVSTNLTDPALRASGSLPHTVKSAVSNVTAADEVAVTNGLLDWTGVSNTDGEVPNNGVQNWTFRTTPGGATYFDWAPYVTGLCYEISFTYRSAWSSPLTFGLSDEVQGGDWDADEDVDYDFAFGSYGSNWQSGEDGTSQNHGGAAVNTEYDVVLKIDEAAGTAKAWVDGTLRATRVIDFENAGRYFSFGESTTYGGYIDDFEVRELERFAISNTWAESMSASEANLYGLLDAAGAVFSVTTYWSTNNNLTSSAWLADTTASNVVAGTYTNVAGQVVSTSIDSLTVDTTYYYTMVASNEVTEIWADQNVSFVPLALGTVISIK